MRSLAVLWSVLLLAGACGRSAPPPRLDKASAPEVIKFTGKLISPTLLTINPSGYNAQLCLSSASGGCVVNGQPRQFNLATEGTYTLSDSGSVDIATNSYDFGTLTVHPDGHVTLDAAARTYFNDPTCDAGGSPATCTVVTVSAKTSDVTFFLPANHYLLIGFAGGVATYNPPTPGADSSIKMIRNRKYWLKAYWSWAPVGVFPIDDERFSPNPDFTLLADGTIQIAASTGGAFSVMSGTSRFTVNATPIYFEGNGYPGGIGFYGLSSVAPGSTYYLIKNRRYYLWSGNAFKLDGSHTSIFSDLDPDLFIDNNGFAQGIAGTGSVFESFSFTGTDNVIRARVAPVNYQSNGSILPLTIYYFFPLFSEAAPMMLMRGRRYFLHPSGLTSVDAETGDAGFDTPPFRPGLQVDYDGALSLIGGPTRNFTFDSTNNVLRPRVQRITINPNGYANQFCLRGLICKTGQPLSEYVIVGRRYTIDPGGSELAVHLDGSCSISSVSLGGTTASVACNDTAPSAPSGLSAKLVSASRVDLTWVDQSPSESGFRVERSADGGGTWVQVPGCAVGQNQIACSDTQGLTSGTVYRYRAHAFNAVGASPYSNVVLVDLALPPAPANLAATVPSSTLVSLRWTSTATNEQGFKVDRSTNGVNFTPIGTPGPDVHSFDDPTVLAGTTYHYRVRAYNGLGDSAAAVVIVSTAPPPAPSGLTATLSEWLGTTGPVVLSWTDVASNEVGYRVERADNGGGFVEIGTVLRDPAGTPYGFVDWVTSGSYSYRLRAYNDLGNSGYSNAASVATSAPTAAVLSANLISATQINLSWTAAGFAASGVLLRSTDGGAFVSIATPNPSTTLSFNDVTVSAGRTYVYRLDATNVIGTVASNTVTMVTAAPAAPTNLVGTVPSTTQIALSWSYTTNTETGFRIERSTNGGAFSQIAQVAKIPLNYTDPGRAANTNYAYRIRAYNNLDNSAYSNAPTVRTAIPPAPTTAAVRLASTTRVDFTWTDTSTNENGFRVERSANGASYVEIATVGPNVTLHGDATVAAGASYTYRVRSYNAFGSSGYATSSSLPLVTPSAPTALAATIPSATRVDLTWVDAATNETAYRVERAADGVNFTTFGDLAAGATSFADTTVMNGTSYVYRVRASNAFGASTAATLTVPFTPPVAVSSLNGSAASTTQINLSWPYTGTLHNGFRIERSANGGAFAVITTQAASARSFNNTGLAANTNYQYRITPFNGIGDGTATTSPVVRTAAPVAPTGLVARVITTSRIDLTWVDASTNETGFRVQQSTNGSSWTTIPPTASPPLAIGATSYSATGLTANTNYWFRVFATSGPGDSGNSNTEESRTSAPNGAPTALVATTVSATQIRLSWTETIRNETAFDVERSPSGTSSWQKIGEAPQKATQYNDTGLQPSTQYFYRVRAYNGVTPPSAYTGTASATTHASCTGVPNGTPCNDGNLCTTNDTCQAGVCTGGPPVTCQAGTACSTFACEPATGQCRPSHRPMGTACNDSNLCTTGDVCNGSGTCGGSPKSCDDGNACTVDACVPATGTCQSTAGTCAVSALTPAPCRLVDSTGNAWAVFGYTSGASGNVEMAYGSNNQLTPAALQGRQPRWFTPGTHEAAIVLPLTSGATISWKLGPDTVSVSGATAICADARATVARTEHFLEPGGQLLSLTTPAPVGTLPGEVDVSHTGNASYSIPLHTPAGRLGIEPNLSLVYSSGANVTGHLGVGWSLAGLPIIHRCGKTAAQDGDPGPITFTSDDALCLDGERLVRTATLADGHGEYRTEKDSHARIRSRSGTPAAPAEFEVRTADGRILIFKATTAIYATFNVDPTSETEEQPDYGIGAPRPPISEEPYHQVAFDWRISEMRDRFDNAMTIRWNGTFGTRANGFAFEVWPEEITYTHLPAPAPAPPNDTRLRGQRSVLFNFYTAAERAAKLPGDPTAPVAYAGGVKSTVSRLLKSIEIKAPNPSTPAVVRRYSFDYEESPRTRRPRLKYVEECDSGTVCKPRTTFEYTNGSDTFEAVPAGVTTADLASSENYQLFQFHAAGGLGIGDVDGDGRDDIAYRQRDSQVVIVRLSHGRGFGPAITVNPRFQNGTLNNQTKGPPNIVDVDGDGKAELLLMELTSFGFRPFHCRLTIPASPPQSLDCRHLDTSANVEASLELGVAGMAPYLLADLNADGRPEFLRISDVNQQGFFFYRENLGALGGYKPIAGVGFGPGLPTTVDLDGDGAEELLFSNRQGAQKRAAFTVRGSGVLERQTNIFGTGSGYQDARASWFVDVNGDGLQDFVRVRFIPVTLSTRDSQLVVQMNTGAGFLPSVVAAESGGHPVTNPYFPNSLAPEKDRDDGVRVIDWDGDGNGDLAFVDNGVDPSVESNDNGYRSPSAHRANIIIRRFRHDGTMDPTPVVTAIPVGLSANGPAGVVTSGGAHCGTCALPNQGSVPLCLNPDPSCLTAGQLFYPNEPHGFLTSKTLDVNGDGFTDFIQVEQASGGVVVHIRQPVGTEPLKADVLRKVTNGLGAVTKIDYRHTGDKTARAPGISNLYTGAVEACPADFSCLKSAQWVVSEIARDNGRPEAEWLRTFYSYKDGRYSRTGWGFLGFGERTEETSRAAGADTIRTSQRTVYRSFEQKDQFFAYRGLPKQVHTIVSRTNPSGGGIRHRTQADLTWEANAHVVDGLPKYYEVAKIRELTRRYEQVLPSSVEQHLTTVTDYLSPTTFGRLRHHVRTVVGGPRIFQDEMEVTAFEPDNVADWLIGPPQRVVTRSSATGSSPQVVRTVRYTYAPITQFLTSAIQEPDDSNPAYRLTTTFTPTAEGHVATILAQDTTGKRRETFFSYDPLERIYRQTATNRLGLTTTTVYHPAVDQVGIARDANGVTVMYLYDSFGRLRKRDMPAGMADVTVTPMVSSPMRILTAVQGEGLSEEEFDRMGRPIRRQTAHAGGSAMVTTDYDVVGRVSRVSRPFSALQPPPPENRVYTHLEYDEIGRLTALRGRNEAGAEATLRRFVYSGLTTTTYELHQSSPLVESKRVLVKDERGLLVTSSEELVNGGSTKQVTAEYSWGPFGLLGSVLVKPDSGAQPVLTTTMTYDRLGRRETVNDSNRGNRSSTFDAFGAMVTHTDPQGQVTSYLHDDVGRVKQRTAPEGTTTWEYDSALRGLGLLRRATSPEGVVDEYSFDALSRPEMRRTTVAGQSFQFENTYDTLGRPDLLRYPETPGWPRLEVRNTYSGTGELVGVTRVDTNTKLWEGLGFDSEGRLTQEKLGGAIDANFTFDPLTGRLRRIQSSSPGAGVVEDLNYRYYDDGNIKWRGDNRDGNPSYEHFSYDSLDRLRFWQAGTSAGGAGSGWNVEYQYDELGNMLSRTTASAPGQTTQLATYGHGGAENAGPSAVTSWNIGGVQGQFVYDGSRRVRQHPRMGTIDYNSFDLPTKITGAVNASFGYDAGGTRAYKDEDLGNGRRSTTLYAGLSEMRVLTGAQTELEHVLHLSAGGRGIGQIVRSRSITGTLSERTNFYSTDHLGSVRAVVDSSGQQRKVLDPFGNRVTNATNPVLDTAPLLMTPIEGRASAGFTGHEHDDVLGVINMRGRIYEPLAQRFLSPDPVVGSGTTAQAWNAYSYVLNSPLAYVDPSGFMPQDMLERRMGTYFLAQAELERLRQKMDEFDANERAWIMRGGAGEAAIAWEEIKTHFEVGGIEGFDPGERISYIDFVWAENEIRDAIAQEGGMKAVVLAEDFHRVQHPFWEGRTPTKSEQIAMALIGAAGVVGGAILAADFAVALVTGAPIAVLGGTVAVPILTTGPGGQMLGQAVGHLKAAASSVRVDMFRQFAQQITKATKGHWSALETRIGNANVFTGEGGEALVFDAAGRMFRGNLGDRQAFPITKAGIRIVYHFLREVK